jgi:hypothetical protein
MKFTLVCGLPDVKCVTYSKYASWFESLNPKVLVGFRMGDFGKANHIQLGLFAAPLQLDINGVFETDTAGQ